MSQVIDERIVEMRFNNQDFEKNATTTLSTLDKLKQALKFDKDTKGIDSIAKSIENVSFDKMNNDLDSAKDKFSILETVAIGAIMRIGNRLADGTIDLAKSLSIDQVTKGFDKYAEKTTAVQTIMAATAGEIGTRFADQGEQLAYINSQMDRLMWFTDETSYNFIDMVNNIGKFTAAGVDIETATNSMMGISTWAAKSGAGIQGASRAMYNLSQAMGAGALKVMDWKSIELANMATMEFKQTSLETAADLGKLKRKYDKDGNLLGYMLGDGLTKAQLAKIKKGEKTIEDYLITAESMRESLKEGWFDKDVMNTVFGKYGEYAQKMNEWYELTGLTASETRTLMESLGEGATETDIIAKAFGNADKAIKETGYSMEELQDLVGHLMFDDFGRSAFYAAQEAKTFQEVIDATKDAVSTGWSRTFEYIFGDYNEAKVLWTDLAERLYTLFMTGTEKRNEALREWHDWGGYEILWDGVGKIWDAVGSVTGTIRDAFDDVFWGGPETLIKMSKAIQVFGEWLTPSEEAMQHIRDAAIGVADVLRGTWIIIRDMLTIASPFLKVVTSMFKTGGSWVLKLLGQIGKALTSVFVAVSQWTTRLANGIKSKSGFFRSLEDGFKRVINVVGTVGGAIGNLGMKVITPVWDGIKHIGDGLLDGWTKLKDAIQPSIEPLQNALGYIKEWGKGAGERLYNKAGNYLDTTMSNLSDYAKNAFDEHLPNIINSIANAINNLCLKIEWYSSLLKDIGLRNTIDAIFHDTSENIKVRYPEIYDFFDSTINSMSKFKDDALRVGNEIIDIVKGDKQITASDFGIENIKDNVEKEMDATKKSFEERADQVSKGISEFIENVKSASEYLTKEGSVKSSDYEKYGNNIANIIENSLAPIKGIYDGFIDSSLFKGLLDYLSNLKSGLSDSITSLEQFGNSVIVNLVDKIQNAYNSIHDFFVDIPSYTEKVGESVGNQLNVIGKAIINLFKGLFKSDLVSNILNGFKSLSNGISNFVNSIPDKIFSLGESLGSHLADALLSAINLIRGIISGFLGSDVITGFREGWKNIFTGLEEDAIAGGEKIGNAVANVAKAVGSAMSTFMNRMFGEGWTVEDIVNTLNSVLTAGLISAITRFVNTSSGLVKSLESPLKAIGKGIGDCFKYIGEGLKGSLDVKTFGNQIAPFIGIAAVIATLAYSFYKLSSLNPDQIEQGKNAIMVVIGALAAALTAIGGINIGSFKLGGIAGKYGAALQMVSLAAIIWTVAHTIETFSAMDPERLAMGIGAMIIMMVAIGKLLKTMSSFNVIVPKDSALKISGLAPVILMLGRTIKTIAEAIAILSDTIGEGNANDFARVGYACIVVGLSMAILFTGVYFLLNAMNGDLSTSSTVSKSLGIKNASFSKDKSTSINGFTGTVGTLLSVAAILVAVGHVVKTIANAISDLATSTASMKSKWTAFGMVVAILGGVMTGLYFLLKTLNTSEIKNLGHKQIMAKLGGIALVIGSLSALFTALSLLTSAAALASPMQLLALTGVLAVVLGSIVAMIPLLSACTAAAPALLSFAAVVVSIGLLFMELGVSISLISAGIIAFGTALFTLGELFSNFPDTMNTGIASFAKLVLVLTALSPALIIAGVAMLPFALSCLTLSAALSTLTVAIALLATQVGYSKLAAKTLQNFINSLFSGLVDGIKTFAHGLGDMAVELGESLYKILSIAAPRAIEGLLEGLLKASDTILTYTPQIIEKLCLFLESVLDSASPYAYDIGKKGGSFISSFCQGLVDGIGDSLGIVAATLGTLLAAGGLFTIAGKFGNFATVGKGILIAIEVAGGLIALITVLGSVGEAFNKIKDSLGFDILDGFVKLCTAVGTAIGSLIGGLAGGIVGGFESGRAATQIAMLSGSIDSIKEMIETINGLDAGSVGGIYNFSKAMSALENIDWSFFSSDINYGQEKSNIDQLKEAVINVAEVVNILISSIDPTNADGAEKAAKAFEKVLNAITGIDALYSNGIKQSWTGWLDLSLLDGLSEIGPAIKTFTDSLKGVEESEITSAISALDALERLVDVVPRVGGLFDVFIGTNSMFYTMDFMRSDSSVSAFTEFASKELPSIGEAIHAFMDNADWTQSYTPEQIKVKTLAITKSIAALSELISIFNSSKVGGLFSELFGENPLFEYNSFDSKLEGFKNTFSSAINKVKTYFDEFAEIFKGGENGTDTVRDVLNTSAEILPSSDVEASKNKSKEVNNRFTEFSKNMSSLAKGLANAGNIIYDAFTIDTPDGRLMNDDKIKSISIMITSIKDLLSAFSEDNIGDISENPLFTTNAFGKSDFGPDSNFAKNIKSLAAMGKEISDEFKDVSPEASTNAAAAVKPMCMILESIGDIVKAFNLNSTGDITYDAEFDIEKIKPLLYGIKSIIDSSKIFITDLTGIDYSGWDESKTEGLIASVQMVTSILSIVPSIIESAKIGDSKNTANGLAVKSKQKLADVQQLMYSITDFMRDIPEQLKTWHEAFNDGSISETDVSNMASIFESIGSLAPAISGLAELSKTDGGIGNFDSFAEGLPKIATAIKNTISALSGEQGTDLQSTISQFSSLAPMLSATIGELTNTLKDAKVPVPSSIFEFSDSFGTEMNTKFSETINSALSSIGEGSSKIKIGGDILEVDAESVKNTLISGLTSALANTDGLTANLTSVTIDLDENLGASITSSINSQLEKASFIVKNIKVQADNIVTDIQAKIDSGKYTAKIEINPDTSALDNLSASGTNIKVGGNITADTTKATEAGTQLVQAVGSAIESFNINGSVASLMSSACSAMAGYVSAFKTIGSYLMSGLNSGLLSMEATITATCARIVSKAAEAANAAGEIKSPSRVFMRIGRYLGMGLEKGINKSESKVSKASTDLANSATDAAKKTLEIHSPSKVWEAIGKACGQGFANGLASTAANTVLTVKSYTSMMSDLIAAETNANKQSKLQNAEDLLSHLDNLGLIDPRFKYDYYTRLNNMADEQLKEMIKSPEGNNENLEKDLLDKRREIEKTLYDLSKDIKDYYIDIYDTGLSSAEMALKSLYEAVDAFSQEEKDALTTPYVEAVKALWDFRDSYNEAVMDFKKSRGLITTDDEIEYYLELIKRYDPNSDKYLQTLTKIDELRNQSNSERLNLADVLGINTFDEKASNVLDKISSMQKGSTEWLNALTEGINLANEDGESWIQKQKDYGRMGIAGELETYYRLAEQRSNYIVNLGKQAGLTQEQINALLANDEKLNGYKKNIHDLTNEASEAIKTRNKAVKEAKKAYKEFTDGTIVNSMTDIWTEDDKLIEKMSENTKTLRDDLQNRRKEFREYFGLFDEVKDDFKEVNIAEMIFNQNDQAEYLNYFTELMDTAKSKLTDKDLIKSLQEMGIDAMPYLRAIAGADSEGIRAFEAAWRKRDEAAKKAALAAESAEMDELIKKEKKKGEEAGKAYQKAYNAAKEEFNKKMYGEDPDGKKAAANGARTLDWMQDNGFTNMGKQTSAMQEMYFDGVKNGVAAIQSVSSMIENWMSSGVLKSEWIYGLSQMFHNMTANGTFGDLTSEDFMHIKDVVMSMNSYGITAGAANIQSIEDLDALANDVFTRIIDPETPITISLGSDKIAQATAQEISFTRQTAQQLLNKTNSILGAVDLLNSNFVDGKLKIVLDTGTLVGELKGEIDRSLGSSTIDSRSDFTY